MAPREATHEQLARVHDPHYSSGSRRLRERAVALDPDTYTSPESYEVALLAAGAAIDAVERDDERRRTRTRWRWCVRPATTPSTRTRWASACSTTSPSPPRTRGTRSARSASPSSTTTSITATARSTCSSATRRCCTSRRTSIPYYPGTGAVDEIGSGAGRGLHGQPAARVRRHGRRLRARVRSRRAAGPAPVRARPDSRLGRLRRAPARSARRRCARQRRVSRAMTMALRRVADECCNGRLALVTEGGYDLKALDASLDAVVADAAGPAGRAAWPSRRRPRSRRGARRRRRRGPGACARLLEASDRRHSHQ